MLKRVKDTLRPYLPRNIRYTMQLRKEREFAHTHIFSSNPAIVYLTWGFGREKLHAEMKNRQLTLLYLFAWWIGPDEVREISKQVHQTLKLYPKHRIVMFCNEEPEVALFRAAGVEAILCSSNCWVNENVFKIDETAVKKYDAIYNAAMSTYKRHPLAAKIKSIGLITYRYKGTHTVEYEEEVQKCFSPDAWLVSAYGDHDKATAAQVCGFYNQSRVGLCLSKMEGAMFASIEYLLSGLPVVTTRNIGGRDVFFDPDYVEWAEDDADSVKEAVANLIARAPSAQVIRARTLEKMEVQRQRLRDLIKDQVSQVEIPWPPGSQGPLNHSNLRALGRQLRRS